MLRPVYPEQEGTTIAKLLIEHLGYDIGPASNLVNEVIEKIEISQLEKWIEERKGDLRLLTRMDRLRVYCSRRNGNSEEDHAEIHALRFDLILSSETLRIVPVRAERLPHAGQMGNLGLYLQPMAGG